MNKLQERNQLSSGSPVTAKRTQAHASTPLIIPIVIECGTLWRLAQPRAASRSLKNPGRKPPTILLIQKLEKGYWKGRKV